jgi:F-type H+-transporting ATPase subunit delta
MAVDSAQIDLTGQQVAAIYGKAFFGAATSAGLLDASIEEFDSLIADVLNANPPFEQLLANRMIGFEQKIEVLDRVLGPQASPVLLNFLKVLAENERLEYLRPILSEVHRLDDEFKKRVRVQVATATPLAEELKEGLEREIRQRMDLEPELVETTDPGLIGGIVVQIGDTVFDGSIVTELQRMRTRLRARNIEEIETNRGRFQTEENPQ